MSNKPRIKLPESYKAGEVIEIRALILHVMETGLRNGEDGRPVPRNIVHTFIAHLDGREVFRAELTPCISANPYIAFHLRVPDAGELQAIWIDDAGVRTVERAVLQPA